MYTFFSKLTFISLRSTFMESFGRIVQTARKNKGWAVRTFIERLGGELSPAYITKIEIHGEIPAPSLICKIAETLDINRDQLLEAAQENKVRMFQESLKRRYEEAVTLHRLQKR